MFVGEWLNGRVAVSKTVDGSSNLSAPAKIKEEDMLNYIKESYNELVNKVTWPTFPQLQSSTVVVMVASAIFAIVVLAMDLTFENMMAAIYKTLGNLGR